LLRELEATPGSREVGYYDAFLPSMVRTAQGLGDGELLWGLPSGLPAPTRW
jgi:hypothetical protein